MVFVAGFCALALYKNIDTPASVSAIETSTPVAAATVGNVSVSVPSWNYFATGQIWNLVSEKHKIPLTYVPELTSVAVHHAPGADQAAVTAEKPLESLVAAAQSDGIALMLSSAYRSAKDQQDTYDSLLALHGTEYVHEYVASPGASEHQTGLAVDFSSASRECELNANDCSLDAEAIAWLRDHAVDYGFIERYPSGKQSITGVAGEHWHYRYVGVPLAKALTKANLTFDEFVQQVALGYSR